MAGLLCLALTATRVFGHLQIFTQRINIVTMRAAARSRRSPRSACVFIDARALGEFLVYVSDPARAHTMHILYVNMNAIQDGAEWKAAGEGSAGGGHDASAEQLGDTALTKINRRTLVDQLIFMVSA